MFAVLGLYLAAVMLIRSNLAIYLGHIFVICLASLGNIDPVVVLPAKISPSINCGKGNNFPSRACDFLSVRLVWKNPKAV